ncbi:MAG: hypothetical protein P8J88_07605 [Phycisphaerales bacterium]|nr:hypothetical protein [Phycisphaerales bacterium]
MNVQEPSSRRTPPSVCSVILVAALIGCHAAAETFRLEAGPASRVQALIDDVVSEGD